MNKQSVSSQELAPFFKMSRSPPEEPEMRTVRSGWESRGQRSLAGCGPQGAEESDTTEWLSAHAGTSHWGWEGRHTQARTLPQSCPTPCGSMDCSPQAPLSMGVSRQEYWSGLPFPRAGDLPHPGTEPESLAPPALAGRFFPPGPPGKTQEEVMRYFIIIIIKSSTQQQPKYPCAYNFTLVKQKRNLKLSKWKKKCIYLQWKSI